MRVPVAVVDFVYLPSVLTATGKTIEAITAQWMAFYIPADL